MSLLAWIVVGIIAGFIAKSAVPGEGPGGVIGDLVVGVAGAILGGWVFSLFGYGGTSGISIYSIIVAVIGAIIFLAILRAVSRPSRV